MGESKTLSGEALVEKARQLCEKEGMKGWKLAQETLLKEKASNAQLQEAINYIMLKYQPEYFRPAFVSFCFKAVGGKSTPAVPTGAALTLFAWAIGIHDDIIDQSKTKDERPTVLGKFGKDLALILSDVLLFKGFTLLRKTLESQMSIESFVRILETIEKIWFEQSVGEAFEIQSKGLVDLTPEECLDKIRMRASEMDACARIGGIIGGGSARQIETLGKYGRLIGMIGILRNELIDMLEFDVLKHRISKESLPLPVIYALQDKSAKSQLVPLITQSRLTKEDLRKISKLSDSFKGTDNVATLINKMSREAYMHANSFKDSNLKILAEAFALESDTWKPLLED